MTSSRRLSQAVSIAGLIGVAYLFFTPARGVSLDGRCQPDGSIQKLKAGMQGRGFWERQLRSIDIEIAGQDADRQAFARSRLEAERVTAEGERTIAETDKVLEDIYRQRPDIRPVPSSDAQRADDPAGWAELDAVLEKGRVARLAYLQRCRPEVLRRLDGRHRR